MRFDKRSILAAILLALSPCAASAQTVTNHAFALGKGPGVTGYTSLLCTSAQLAVGQAAADPICQTITGDVTISAGGVTAIGASKVLNAMLATMAANTTKCNATAGTANPTDCNAATMRTNLGLVIGTNVQAWDTDLDCLAAISTTGAIKRTGAGTCSAGALALTDLATGTQDTVIGYFGATTASAASMPNCSGALIYSTSTHLFGCNAASGTGTVTEAKITSSGGIANTGNCDVTTSNSASPCNLAFSPAAWATYTPTISCSSGTLTTSAASGYYQQFGKTLFLNISITLTSVGTCVYPITATLPVGITSFSIGQPMYGRENNLNAKAVVASVGASGTVISNISYYDNTTPVANGAALLLGGVLQTQ